MKIPTKFIINIISIIIFFFGLIGYLTFVLSKTLSAILMILGIILFIATFKSLSPKKKHQD